MIVNGTTVKNVTYNGGGVQTWIHNGQTVYQGKATLTFVNNGARTSYSVDRGTTVTLSSLYTPVSFGGYGFNGFVLSNSSSASTVYSLTADQDYTIYCKYYMSSARASHTTYNGVTETYTLTVSPYWPTSYYESCYIQVQGGSTGTGYITYNGTRYYEAGHSSAPVAGRYTMSSFITSMRYTAVASASSGIEVQLVWDTPSTRYIK